MPQTYFFERKKNVFYTCFIFLIPSYKTGKVLFSPENPTATLGRVALWGQKTPQKLDFFKKVKNDPLPPTHCGRPTTTPLPMRPSNKKPDINGVENTKGVTLGSQARGPMPPLQGTTRSSSMGYFLQGILDVIGVGGHPQ